MGLFILFALLGIGFFLLGDYGNNDRHDPLRDESLFASPQGNTVFWVCLIVIIVGIILA